MVAQAWRETTPAIIQNCFKKAGFIHHKLDPEPQPKEPPVAPNPGIWNKVQKWMEMNFDKFVDDEPEVSTTEPMTDKEIVDLVRTDNDAPEEDSDDEEDDISSTNIIKSTTEFLNIIEQQKAFLTRNKLPTDVIKQLKSLVIANQLSLCCKLLSIFTES